MVTSPELIYFASRRITATNSYAQTTTIFCLVAWPLGWGHGEWLLASGGVLLAREGSSELSEGSLVVAHANSEGLEVVELVGETHGTAVEEHEVTGVVGHLVHLESTLAEHGLLELEEKVLAETHGPAGTHGVGDTGVLVDEVVNLNVLGSEDSGDLGGTSTDTLGLDSLDVGEGRNSGEEVTEGGEVLALALDDVLLELVAGSDGVGLEGEEVISDLLVGALDGLEEVVSGVLNTLRDLDEHGTLLASEVATGTVGHTARLSLTNHDGAGDSLLHILAHGLGLLTDELTVELASGLVAADHTGEHLEAGLDLAGVGGDDVTEGVEASVEGSLGGADGSGGLLAVGRDGGSVGLVLVGSLKLDVGKLGVETLGGLGKVTGSLDTVRSGTATDLGELGDAGELSVGATVHTELDGTVAGNLTGHDGDLTRETSLLVLDGSDSAGNAGGEGLASIGHLLGGLGAGSGDVLHGLGETGVSEGGLLGDTVVDVLHGAGEGGVGGSTLLGHVAVELTELVGGTVAGGNESTIDRLERGTETGGRLGVGSVDGRLGGTASGRDLGGQGVHVGLHGGIDILGLLGEGIGVGGDLVVGLLDLLGGLDLEGKEGTVHGRHGIGKLTLGGLLVASDGTGKRGTAGDVLAGSLALLSVGVGESDLGDLDGSGEVLLSLSSGGTDSVEELTAHLTAGLSRGETEVLDLGGGVLGELGHLRGDTHVEGCLGLLVHVLELHLSLHHADLTLVHGTGDGSLKLHLVGLHDSGELGAALGVAHSVGTDDTSELVHLTLELLVVLHDVTVESGHTLGEIVLGGTEFVLDVETSVTGLGGELAVDLHLSLLALGDGSVELTGLLGEHVGGVVSHSLEASISRGLVGVDEVLKLGVLLKVLLVTLVTDLDHAVGLGTHVGVDLGLLELVLGDNTGELGDASVGLGDLLLHGGAEEVDLGLELGTSGGDTGLGLGLGSGDVLHGLSEVGVVECLGGVEGRSHTGSRRLERHIGVVTVSSHLGTDATEVSGGIGHHDLQLVVGPLASGLVLCGELGRELGAALGGLGPSVGNLLVKLVDGTLERLAGSLGILLDLGSIDGDVLVGLGNARVDRGLVGGHGALLGLDGNAQLVSGVGLVAGDTGTDQLGAMDVRAVATVSEDRSLVEAVLHEAHGTSEVILGLLGIDSHLVKKGTLELLACGLVEREVA